MVERELGEVFTISIGTAQALEGLAKERDNLKYDNIYINVRTLFRNFENAIVDIEKHNLTEVRNAFLEELDMVKTTIQQAVSANLTPVFYICSNKSMAKLFPHAKIKQATTTLQKNFQSLERKVMEFIMESEFGQQVKIFDCSIKGSNQLALILTHFPLELLSYPNFRKLDLLESHTGVIKPRAEWNSKLTNPEHYRNLPFNILTLQLIGDQATQFNSLGIKFIKPVMEIAEKNKWTPATTREKIKHDLNKYFDKLLVNIMTEMINTKLK